MAQVLPDSPLVSIRGPLAAILEFPQLVAVPRRPLIPWMPPKLFWATGCPRGQSSVRSVDCGYALPPCCNSPIVGDDVAGDGCNSRLMSIVSNSALSPKSDARATFRCLIPLMHCCHSLLQSAAHFPELIRVRFLVVIVPPQECPGHLFPQ